MRTLVSAPPSPPAPTHTPSPLARVLAPLLGRVPGEGVRALGRNVTWQLGDRVVRLVVGLVVNVWMVRYLGAAGLGLLGFVQSLVGLCAIASTLGIESILIRELVRRPARAGALLGTAAAMKAAGALVAIGISLAAVAMLRPHDGSARALALVLASVTLFQITDVIEHWFQSRARFAPFVIARGAAFLTAAAVKIVLLVRHGSLTQLAAAIALESLLAAFALVAAFRRAPDAPRRWHADPALARELLAWSWPLALNSMAIVIGARMDQVMLTTLRGEAENGLYAAAQRLSEIIYFVPVAVCAAANPLLLGWHARDPRAYEERLGRLFRVLAWSAIAIALPVSLLATPIATLLFGAAFRASGPVLALHVWTAPALFLGVAQSNWFIANGRPQGLFARSAVNAGTNIALNAWLIPPYGARGAALATLIATAVAHVGVNAVTPGTRRLFALQLRALVPGVGRS